MRGGCLTSVLWKPGLGHLTSRRVVRQRWVGPKSAQALALSAGRAVCRARRLSPEATAGESRGGGRGCSPELGHLSAEDLSFISTHSQRSANLSICWWLYRILWGVGVVWSHP